MDLRAEYDHMKETYENFAYCFLSAIIKDQETRSYFFKKCTPLVELMLQLGDNANIKLLIDQKSDIVYDREYQRGSNQVIDDYLNAIMNKLQFMLVVLIDEFLHTVAGGDDNQYLKNIFLKMDEHSSIIYVNVEHYTKLQYNTSKVFHQRYCLMDDEEKQNMQKIINIDEINEIIRKMENGVDQEKIALEEVETKNALNLNIIIRVETL